LKASINGFVILSAAKDLPTFHSNCLEILRCAQDDKGRAQDDKAGAEGMTIFKGRPQHYLTD
jgi:hypothetical protein